MTPEEIDEVFDRLERDRRRATIIMVTLSVLAIVCGIAALVLK